MRRLLLLILLFVLTCFLIPIIFSRKYKVEEEMIETENNVQQEKQGQFDYNQYSKIKLLHNETGEIEEMLLDDYLHGVVAAEMPADFDIEALKAQAVVARTYTIYKIKNGSKHEEADICDQASCCQAWISKEERFAKWEEKNRETNWNKIVLAVDSTKGQIITYEGEPINAFFHSNSGGITETVADVWGGTNYPYLQVVETSGEDAYNQYSSEVTVTKEEVISKIKEYHNDIEIDFSGEDAIKILDYTRKWESEKC